MFVVGVDMTKINFQNKMFIDTGFNVNDASKQNILKIRGLLVSDYHNF